MNTEKDNNSSRLFSRATFQASSGLSYAGALITVLLMLMIVADVLMRYVFLKPITGVNEIAQIMLGYIALLSLAAALNAGIHVRVSLLTARLSRQAQGGLAVIQHVLGAFFFACLAYGGWVEFLDALIKRETMVSAIPIPFWILAFALPLGAFVIMIQFISYLVRGNTELRGN